MSAANENGELTAADRVTAGIEQASVAGEARRWCRRGPELVARILERADEPWMPIQLGGKEIARVPLRAFFTLTGASGAGKSSLALQFASEHARNVGPVVYLTIELDDVEAAARVIGQQCGAGWGDVLRGGVEETRMHGALELPRLWMLEGTDATIANMGRAVAEANTEYPGEPCLVVIDYLQILQLGDGNESERTRIASIVELLRTEAKRLRVVILALSQTSRAVATGLRKGEAIGADTTSAGAESSQIERASYLTLALGGVRPSGDGDRVTLVDLNIGKNRMGGGDAVLPLRFDGHAGHFTITGPAVSAATRRAEANAEAAERKSAGKTGELAQLARDISDALERSPEPLTREQLRATIGKGSDACRAAVNRLLAVEGGDVVFVEVKAKRSSSLKLWTRKRAVANSLGIAELSTEPASNDNAEVTE